MGTTIVPAVPWEETQIENFRGPWTRLEATDVPPTQALQALDAEFNPGQVATRTGFGPLWNPAKAITSLFNWIKASDGVSAKGNYIVVYNATDGKVQWAVNLLAPTLVDLFTVTAEAVDPASSGNQLFLPTINATNQMTPVGAAQLRIVGINVAATNVDKAFLGPTTVKPTLTNTGIGNVTPGQHFVGYIITTRNGFTGPISPVGSSGLPDQTSVIVAPGGQQIQAQISMTWPVEAVSIQIVMTADSNQFQYFTVPGASFGVPGGALFTATININISDDQLINNTNDVTDNQYFLTQDSLGNGPFNPFKVVIYGDRTVYLTYDGNSVFSLYISELNNPQQITEQFHKRHLPGFLMGTSSFVLDRSLYVLGPNWTYAFADNGGLPTTWASARLVDGQIGTPSVMGVTVTASGQWAAVAHISGLYIFTGVYSDKPVSYMVDDQWRRINWAAAQTIRVADNHDKKQIVVLAPLDGATTPTHLLVFDYSDGLDEQSVKFSLWSFKSAGFQPRGLCVAQNVNTGRLEFLVSNGTAGKILRQMNTTDDTNPYNDDGAAIGGGYELAPQPQGRVGQLYAFPGMFVRGKGVGTITPISYTLDHAKSKTWAKPIVLSASPGQEFWRQFYLIAERCSTFFPWAQNPNEYMILSGVRQMFYEYARRR